MATADAHGGHVGPPLRAATLVLLFFALAVPALAAYVRSAGRYAPPDVTLVDERGERVRLAAVLDHPGPVLLQFIFTTCPSICPALSTTFSAAQGELGGNVRLVSISIDPEFDTPARLRDYARRFKAGPRWTFLTGSREDVVAVRKAFGAFTTNKMSHEPLTFLRPEPGAPWARLSGALGAAELVDEVRRLQ